MISLYGEQDIVELQDIPVTISESHETPNGLETVIDDHKPVPLDKQRKYKHLGPLDLSKNDIRLERHNDNLDIIVRKKPYINSILLTNYYWRHNKKRIREYGLRSRAYNSINGNEKRLFKKQFIGKKQGLYFLTASSVWKDRVFNRAFRIRLPKYVVYGYKNSNELYGIIKILDGVKLNIRTFKRKYNDYRGSYRDNPITIVLKDQPSMVKEHPVVTKIKEIVDEQFVEVHVHYESKSRFFKSFLVREENEKNFSEIGFSTNDEKIHRHAVLIDAFYKGGIGKYLTAIIYFRRDTVPKTYYIIAIDKNGTHSVGRVLVKVPASDARSTSETPPHEDTEEGEYWYNEGEF